jgi:MFS transporter, SET family, sugar efflux transporter
MSMFLVDHLGTDPIYIGVFTVSTAVMSLLVNRNIGNLIDRGISAKTLFLMANSSLVITGFLFSVIDAFWQAVLVGVTLFSAGNSCIPILLVMIRRHADQSGLRSAELNAQMRGGVSIMWIVGPALSFSCIEKFGFSFTYVLAASMALLALLLGVWLLPDYPQPVVSATKAKEAFKRPSSRFWLFGSVILLGNFCNGLYIVAMPLYIKQDLGLAESAVGLMLGLAAALEVPALLLAPKLSTHFTRHRVFTAAFYFAALFFLTVQLTDSYALLLFAQLFNGLFYGIFAGLGISILQDELPERTGYASSFYTNALRTGSMFGSSSAGILAQFYGYHNSLIGSLVGAVLALTVLYIIRHFFAQQECEVI